MTIKDSIPKAIEGGWKPQYVECTHKIMADETGCPFGKHYPPIHEILLDPSFWQALGKSEGWEVYKTGRSFYIGANVYHRNNPKWKYRMHDFIDNLAQGQDIETAFDNATK